MKICLVFRSIILTMPHTKLIRQIMLLLSDACRRLKHSWCLAAAYDKEISATSPCTCACHKEDKELPEIKF